LLGNTPPSRKWKARVPGGLAPVVRSGTSRGKSVSRPTDLARGYMAYGSVGDGTGTLLQAVRSRRTSLNCSGIDVVLPVSAECTNFFFIESVWELKACALHRAAGNGGNE